MKLFALTAVFALVVSTSFANEVAKKKQGHDKEHSHVEGDKMDHGHDDAHHKDHDHKAHHPEHDDAKVKPKKK